MPNFYSKIKYKLINICLNNHFKHIFGLKELFFSQEVLIFLCFACMFFGFKVKEVF